MRSQFNSVADVVDWHLCLGCGVCAFICPDQRIRLVDQLSEGIRPLVQPGDCGSCRQCLEVCPACENDHTAINMVPDLIKELKPFYGPVLEIWEGHAVDPQIRFAGSSGGLITALSLYCLEQEAMHGVLHVGQNPENPLQNQTTMSLTRKDLITRTGSRYAPASACDRLDLIEAAPAQCVFVGQPTEVTALKKARKLRPLLNKNIGLTISFFCAGSPSTQGTLDLLRSMCVSPSEVKDLRYRGNGWPGMFAVTLKGQFVPAFLMTYKESWGFVQAYRPFSVHLCPDGTGEDADVSCGDPWYREVKEGEPGSSMLLIRTERGRTLVRKAMEAGYIELQRSKPSRLVRSQENLIHKRGAIWGRLAVLRVCGLPAPRLAGFSLFQNWLRLSCSEKLRSILGTFRRIIQRGYYRRNPL